MDERDIQEGKEAFPDEPGAFSHSGCRLAAKHGKKIWGFPETAEKTRLTVLKSCIHDRSAAGKVGDVCRKTDAAAGEEAIRRGGGKVFWNKGSVLCLQTVCDVLFPVYPDVKFGRDFW